MAPTEGWYPDPAGRHQERYWQGEQWTDHVRDDGRPGVEPMQPQTAAAASSAATRPIATAILVLGSAALIVVGALLPWAEARAGLLSVSKAGTDGDGMLALLFAAGAVLAGLPLARGPIAAWRVAVLAVLFGLVLIVAAVDIADVVKKGADAPRFASMSVGSGLWLTAVAAVAGLIGSLTSLRRS